MKILRLLPGVVLVVLAFTWSEARRPEGGLLPLGWAIGVGGLALALAGAALLTRWQRAANLLSLALCGQASALAMIDVRSSVDLIQHYRAWPTLLTTRGGLWLVLPCLQSLVVAVLLHRSRRAVVDWIRETLTRPVAVLMLGFLLATAAYPAKGATFYLGEVLLATWICLVNLGNLALVAAALPAEFWTRVSSYLTRLGGPASGFEPTPWIGAAWVTVVSGSIAYFVFDRVPHIPDDVGYYFQAKYLSLGKLYLPAPPVPAAFELDKLHCDGEKWWNYGFPAWPAVLAIGVRLGVPWLVNPVLAGLTVLLTWSLLVRQYGHGFARAVVVLMGVSPWFLFMSSSFMSHPLSVLWTLVAMLGLQRTKASGRALWGLVTGAAVGALLLNRPLEALAVAGALGIWILTFGDRWLMVRTVAAVGVSGIAVGALIFPYDRALTGSPFVTAHEKWAGALYGGGDRLGFGPDIGNLGWTHLDPLPGHGLPDIVINASQNTYNIGFDLFGWSFGSLGFAALFLLWRKFRAEDWIFVLVAAAVIFAHSFYWFSGGPDFGARYWYQTLIPLVVLSARGIEELQARWSRPAGNGVVAKPVLAFVALASLVALINFVPWRSLAKYYRYRGMDAHVATVAASCDFGHALVFVDNTDKDDYAPAFIHNPPSLDAPGPIYVRNLGEPIVRQVAEAFPDRSTWFISGSPFRNEKVRVKAGRGANMKPSCPQ